MATTSTLFLIIMAFTPMAHIMGECCDMTLNATSPLPAVGVRMMLEILLDWSPEDTLEVVLMATTSTLLLCKMICPIMAECCDMTIMEHSLTLPAGVRTMLELQMDCPQEDTVNVF